MYKILTKEKTKEGYVWKHTQTMEADDNKYPKLSKNK